MTMFVVMEAGAIDMVVVVAQTRRAAQDHIFFLKEKNEYDGWYIVEVPVVE